MCVCVCVCVCVCERDVRNHAHSGTYDYISIWQISISMARKKLKGNKFKINGTLILKWVIQKYKLKTQIIDNYIRCPLGTITVCEEICDVDKN